jgi:hypothetical protein
VDNNLEKNITYAGPRNITRLEECNFYHTMDLPGYGTIHGPWDLRGKENSYLGNTNFQGKTVLEIGTASGHLGFYMEKQGAQVTAFDLSKGQEWDTVPFARKDYKQDIEIQRENVDKLNNSFWLAHRVYKSNTKMVYGSVYQMPDALGEFDICTFGCVLLHLRDPFLALQRASAHVKNKIIIVESPARFVDISSIFHFPHFGKWIRFLPDASNCESWHTWWGLTPELIIEFIKILGFEDSKLSFHTQIYNGRKVRLFTVVGQRKP